MKSAARLPVIRTGLTSNADLDFDPYDLDFTPYLNGMLALEQINRSDDSCHYPTPEDKAPAHYLKRPNVHISTRNLPAPTLVYAATEPGYVAYVDGLFITPRSARPKVRSKHPRTHYIKTENYLPALLRKQAW